MGNEDRLTMYEACLYHSRSDRALRLIVGKCIEKYKVTMMEWLLLGVVGDGPPEGLNMSNLARQLEVTRPQVTALTIHLLRQKSVKQKAAKHDRRNRYVLITGKGKNLLEDIEEDIESVMKEWLRPIPKDQLRIYMDTVKQISSLDQQSSTPVEQAPVKAIDSNTRLSVNVTGEEV
jgi:DNA-binding MarR family transcriptional regulator